MMVRPRLERRSKDNHLTAREIDVLKLLARGYHNCAIADALFLSPGTVRIYVSRIYEKMGIDTKQNPRVAVALRFAHKSGEP